MDFSEKSAEEIRIYMSTIGWMSEDRLSNLGWGNKVGYSIWFWRWDWHNVKLGNKVCFHYHTDDLSKIDEVVAKTAIKALKAWQQFPDKVPGQLDIRESGVEYDG